MRGDEDFAGLRAYQPGMPLKHMAWKVLARGGDAAVQSYTALAAQPEWLEWSSLEGQDTETRLSQLCLWVLESEAAQRVFGLRIPGQGNPARARRRAPLRLFAALAVIRNGRAAMNPKSVSFEQLCGDLRLPGAGLGRALRVPAGVGVSRPWRCRAACGCRSRRRGRMAPPRALRLGVAALAIALLFAQFRTFNGLSAGTALLALMAGLKMLETDTQRDIYVITLIIYFVCLSALLESTSFWLLAYLVGVCWLTTAALLRLTGTPCLCRTGAAACATPDAY